MLKKFPIPSSWQLNDEQQIAFFEDRTAFVFDTHGKLEFDLKYRLDQESLHLVFNDDASWIDFTIKETKDGFLLEGLYKSYIKDSERFSWHLLPSAMLHKPKAKNLLQAVRFADFAMIEHFAKSDTPWNEMLIEAATCGHTHLFDLLLTKSAALQEKNEASMALTKAIQYGHEEAVKELLNRGANIHHDSFDLDRDNFYHACFLYQVQPEIGAEVIEMMLDREVDLKMMSAYYLTALMYVYPRDPRSQAVDDTKMLQKLLDKGTPMNDYMLISPTEKDTPFMHAAHMGLIEPMKLLMQNRADIFAGFEGVNAYDRFENPLIVDALMPCQGSEEVGMILREAGLKPSQRESLIELENESVKKEGSIEDLDRLFI